MSDLWPRSQRSGPTPIMQAKGSGRRRMLWAGLTLLAGPSAYPWARAAEELPETEILPELFDGPVTATLTMPADRQGRAVPAVVLLHDSLGPDPRGEPYARQLLGAGIAVLEVLADTVAVPALRTTLLALAADARINPARLGILGFGQGAAGAMAAALPVAARALLYPGCAALADAAGQAGGWTGAPMLVLHGGADRANPPASCAAAAEALLRTGARVQRVEYRGASYAWDHPAFGAGGRVMLPAPAGAAGNGRVEALPWPALTAVSAGQVAGFFARELLP